VRAAYRERRDRLAVALASRVPGARLRGLPAGLHVVVELPDGVAARAAVEAGERRGVRFEALADFRAPAAGVVGEPDGDDRCVVVGFGAPPAHAYAAALEGTVAALVDVCG
jgi:GntR family transcriptional regulator/MocR family aminotransferase